MKKFCALLLALVTLLSFVLTACGNGEESSSPADSSAVSDTSSQESSADTSSGKPGSEQIGEFHPSYCTVISNGASYTTSAEAGSSYEDSYRKELTDGQFAPKTGVGYSDSKLSGYSTSGAALTVVIDLGEVYDTIYHFEVSYLNSTQAGVGAPGGISVQISEDNENWTRVGSLKKPANAETDTMQVATLDTKKYFTGRYVRFVISPSSAWLFLDEIQVCADVEGENMDAAYLELLTNHYASNATTSAEREGMLASVRGDEIDRTKNCNLISANCKYTLSATPLADYNDTTGAMLTDGVESHYFEGGTWVGLPSEETVSVTVDLGSARTDIAEFAVSVFTNTVINLYAPLEIVFEVSDDGKTFTEVGSVYGPSDTTQMVVSYRLCLSQAVKGRYVRFTFTGANGDFFLVEECGVYAYGEETEGLVLYPDVVLPEVSANDYWSSSVSDYTKVQNLILGKTQQIMSCDSVTADMIENNTPVTSTLLTDGRYAAAYNIHNGSFFKFSNGGSRDVIYDLEHISEVQGVKVSFLNYTDWAVRLPTSICVYLSDDGENWYEVYEIDTTTEIDNKTVQFDITFDKPYAARFVAFSFDVKAWAAADELEVIGTKKVSSSAQKLANTALKSIKLVPNGYLAQSDDLLGGSGDIVLMYHGKNYNNTVESTLPYVGYLDANGNIKDTMFDGFLYLLTGDMPSGNAGHEQTTMSDWTWYLDDLFADGENLDALNTVASTVNDALGINKTYNFYVAMFIPNCKCTNFGDVDGDGTSENFSNMEDRYKAINWYMDEFYKRLDAAGFDNLSFQGFYWYNESVSTYDDPTMFELVRGIADRVHARDTQFFWIPYFTAAGYSRWASFGFDVACYQPNYAFNGSVLEGRMKEAAAMMRKFGMCTEMEISEEAFSSDIFYEKYMNYLKYGITEGYMTEAIHMYYQGVDIFSNAAYHDSAKYRLIYEYTYQFIKETLQYAPETREAMSFTASADTPMVGTLAPEGEENISYRVSISPEHGSVTVNEDGTFVYYPDKGFTGTDTFSYEISAQLGYSDACEVTVTVE